MADLSKRMIRAAKLDVHLYEEVEADPSAMSQATLIVVMAALAGGVATIGRSGIAGLLIGTFGALISWYIWAYITYFIGAKLFPEPQTHADHGQLLRVLGFAATPGVIRVLGILPVFSVVFFAVANIWMLVTTVVAVRQALDYKSTARAFFVCLLGWIVQTLILGTLLALLRG